MARVLLHTVSYLGQDTSRLEKEAAKQVGLLHGAARLSVQLVPIVSTLSSSICWHREIVSRPSACVCVHNMCFLCPSVCPSVCVCETKAFAGAADYRILFPETETCAPALRCLWGYLSCAVCGSVCMCVCGRMTISVAIHVCATVIVHLLR